MSENMFINSFKPLTHLNHIYWIECFLHHPPNTSFLWIPTKTTMDRDFT